MSKRFFIAITVLVILSVIAVGSVSAGSVSVSGTIDNSHPTMPVVQIDDTGCVGQGTTPVHYDVYHLTVDVAGVYTIAMTHSGSPTNLSLYLFDSTFDPANGFPSCSFTDSSTPETFTATLATATIYYVVPFDDTLPDAVTGEQQGGSYTLTVDGPGNPVLTEGYPDPAACSTPIPEGSVIGEAPLGAQVYWEPGKESPGLVLNPGTYYVIGQDASETYYKLFFNCQYIWVRKDTMQPSWLPP